MVFRMVQFFRVRPWMGLPDFQLAGTLHSLPYPVGISTGKPISIATNSVFLRKGQKDGGHILITSYDYLFFINGGCQEQTILKGGII